MAATVTLKEQRERISAEREAAYNRGVEAEKKRAGKESKGQSFWDWVLEVVQGTKKGKKKIEEVVVALSPFEQKDLMSLQAGTADSAADYIQTRRRYAAERAAAGDMEEADKVENSIKVSLVVLGNSDKMSRDRYQEVMVITLDRAAQAMFDEKGFYPAGYTPEPKAS